MTKQLILSCFFGVVTLSASAVENTLTYTYAGDELDCWGKGKSEIYNVAIHINNPVLTGKRITGIRAVLNADEGIGSTSLWLSKELKLEKIDGVKVTVPDTYSAEVPVEKTTLPDAEDTFGQLSATLDTPYELTADGIYVGYSLTVLSVEKGEELTDKQKKPLLLSKCDNPESLYLHTSKDFVNWMPYNATLGCAAMIYVTFEGDFAEYSINLNSLSTAYATVNEDFTVNAAVSNIGINPVSQIGYSYSVNGKEFEATFDLDTPIEPDFVNVTSGIVKLPIAAIDELGDHTLDLKITTVNGSKNVSTASSASTKISVLPFVPVHRPMLEEFTGTWCGWCPRGYIALEELNKAYGDDVVLAAYHNGDYMAVTSYPVSFGGAPSAILDRNGIEDPYFGTGSLNAGFGMKKEVLDVMETWVDAAIEVTATWENEAKTYISVKAVSKFLENKTNTGYKVGYLLINNGLTGTGNAWNQVNYYANYPGSYKDTELEVLTTWPASVSGLTFNDVVVDVTGMMGVDDSIPNDVEYNTPYETSFTFDIARNHIIQDKDELYVAAFIINPDGTILNSNKVKVSDEAAKDLLGADVSEISAVYYNLSGVRVSAPQDGIFIKVSKMSDGSVRTSKVIR